MIMFSKLLRFPSTWLVRIWVTVAGSRLVNVAPVLLSSHVLHLLLGRSRGVLRQCVAIPSLIRSYGQTEQTQMCSEGELGMSVQQGLATYFQRDISFILRTAGEIEMSGQCSKPPLWRQLSSCALRTWRSCPLRCHVGVAVRIWGCWAVDMSHQSHLDLIHPERKPQHVLCGQRAFANMKYSPTNIIPLFQNGC